MGCPRWSDGLDECLPVCSLTQSHHARVLVHETTMCRFNRVMHEKKHADEPGNTLAGLHRHVL